jgi:peptidoglycan hydrolase CwlO-like protein
LQLKESEEKLRQTEVSLENEIGRIKEAGSQMSGEIVELGALNNSLTDEISDKSDKIAECVVELRRQEAENSAMLDQINERKAAVEILREEATQVSTF